MPRAKQATTKAEMKHVHKKPEEVISNFLRYCYCQVISYKAFQFRPFDHINAIQKMNYQNYIIKIFINN